MVHEIFTASGSFQILCRIHYSSTTSNYELLFLCPGKIFDFHIKYISNGWCFEMYYKIYLYESQFQISIFCKIKLYSIDRMEFDLQNMLKKLIFLNENEY